MLTALSIRDIVLIEKLDLAFNGGFTVFTGETGAGKSILLECLGLISGARGDARLVRKGCLQGVVTAQFALPDEHPAFSLLQDMGIDADGDLIIRRLQPCQGASRAFVNDQPVSVALLRQLGPRLLEIHGQHDDRALIHAATHRRLLDSFGRLEKEVRTVATDWEDWQTARTAYEEARAAAAEAETQREFTVHALKELHDFAPAPGEEEQLSGKRHQLLAAGRIIEALAQLRQTLSNEAGFQSGLNTALRQLEKRRAEAGGLLDGLIEIVQRLSVDMGEATAVAAAIDDELSAAPEAVEAIEERLFALRALARKHLVGSDELASVAERLQKTLEELDHSQTHLCRLKDNMQTARTRYTAGALALSQRRRTAAARLDHSVTAELGPLKLGRALFRTVVDTDDDNPSSHGVDRISFLASANPGIPPGPLATMASGGELARIMLALKVSLAGDDSAPCLIFDEIDTGVGGAVADAIGARLQRLSRGGQVLAVTHSPQVAAYAARHLLVSKAAPSHGPVQTTVNELNEVKRREEIARMLSAADITREARAQAGRLLQSGTERQDGE